MKFRNLCFILGIFLAFVLVISGVSASPIVGWFDNIDSSSISGLTLQLKNNISYDSTGFYNFNGINQYMVTNLPLINNNNSLNTICAWFNSSNVNPIQKIVEAVYGSSDGSRSGTLYVESGSLRYIMRNTTNVVINSTLLQNNTFYFGCGNWNGTDINLYLNGNLVSTKQFNNNLQNGTVAMTIGRESSGNFYFNGSIDEIRVYNRSLDSSEITQLYNQGQVKNTSLLNDSLVFYDSFDSRGYASITGSGNLNLTYLNSTWYDPLKINEYSNNNWDLFSTIKVNSATVNLTLNNNNVNTIRLFSDGLGNYADIYASAFGVINITGINVYSWNGTGVQLNSSQLRSQLYFDTGTASYITNSNFSYLGDGIDSTDRLYAIGIRNSPNSLFSNNIITNSTSGFISRTSANTTISNNVISYLYRTVGNGDTIGIQLLSSLNSLVDSNIVFNLTSSNYTNQQSVGISGNHISDNAMVSNNLVYNGDLGIDWYYDNRNITFLNNTVYDMNFHGLIFERTTHNSSMINNTVYNCGKFRVDPLTGNYAITASVSAGEDFGTNNIIQGNIIYNCEGGISMYKQINPIIFNNTILNRSDTSLTTNVGIGIQISENVTIRNNYINGFNESGYDVGLRFGNSSNIRVYGQDFGDNNYDVDFNSIINKNISFFDFVSNNYLIINRLDSGNQTVSIFNLTNALIYNTNGSIYGSNTISENDGNINITLTPNNASYVLDNFNLTEGVSRTNSPIWISSSSYTNKHIASNLIDTINTTVSFIVSSCENIGTITYTSNSGATVLTFDGRPYCSNYYVTLDNIPIETATNSNEFLITYNAAQLDTCTGFFDAGISFTNFIVVLIIVSIAGLVLVFLLGGDSNMDTTTLIAGTIIVGAIVMSIGMIIINTINGC